MMGFVSLSCPPRFSIFEKGGGVLSFRGQGVVVGASSRGDKKRVVAGEGAGRLVSYFPFF